MKKISFLLLLSAGIITRSYSQKITPSDLVGEWDQNITTHAAAIIFDDTSHVRFSYKGRTGSTKKYYYLLDNSQTPAILTVDYKANHKKHRNEYLIQMVDKNTIKLQVLHKKDNRQNFDESGNSMIITLIRKLDL
ncbi:MAG TPA: hypothetical protein VKT28_10955 [Puia sp.]|nr:hypothetical protein [Puia sp.]